MAQILSNLPIGAKIKFGKHSINGETAQDIIWTIVAKNHTGYPSNSVTLLTSRIIDLRAYDAKEPNSNIDGRVKYGNSEYDLSNIDQWLNKSATAWFEKTHTYDQAPAAQYVTGGTEYDGRPGFLSNFTESEIADILSTSITFTGPGYIRSATRKIFLPSAAELGYTGWEDGTSWGYFDSSNWSERAAMITAQCRQNTKAVISDTSENLVWQWGLRSAISSSRYELMAVKTDGKMTYVTANDGTLGIRPAMNLSSSQKVSDTTDSDGCYTVIYNTAPHNPLITIPSTIYAGKPFVIKMAAEDDEGDVLSIELQRSTYANNFVTIYSGEWQDSITDTVPLDTTLVRYRFRAIDTEGEASGWAEVSPITIVNNHAPVISVPSGNITITNNKVDFTYTVSDADNDTITITEMVNDQTIRSYTATGSRQSSFVFDTLKLPNGTHTITITATDSIDTTTKTLSFVKSVSSLMVQNDPPYRAIEMPTRIKVSVTRNIPEMAVFKVEVCNNAYDSTTVWEDATSSVISGLNHIFTNTKKESGKDWGVRIRVTVDRNGGSGACYVSAIGGNFE